MGDKKWELEFEDIAHYDNEANGGFREWVGLEEESLVELFNRFLGVNSVENDVPIKIKAKDGKVVFQTK